MTFFSQDRVAAVDKAIMRDSATLREIHIGREAISPVLNMRSSRQGSCEWGQFTVNLTSVPCATSAMVRKHERIKVKQHYRGGWDSWSKEKQKL